jgi:hypothetical protein
MIIISEKTMQIAEMVDMLPKDKQNVVYEYIKKLILEWDPDFTKLTPNERVRLEKAEAETETVDIDDIDWD